MICQRLMLAFSRFPISSRGIPDGLHTRSGVAGMSIWRCRAPTARRSAAFMTNRQGAGTARLAAALRTRRIGGWPHWMTGHWTNSGARQAARHLVLHVGSSQQLPASRRRRVLAQGLDMPCTDFPPCALAHAYGLLTTRNRDRYTADVDRCRCPVLPLGSRRWHPSGRPRRPVIDIPPRRGFAAAPAAAQGPHGSVPLP